MSVKTHLLVFTLALIFTLEAASAQYGGDYNDDDAFHARHEQWIARYGRVYQSDDEKHKRFLIYKENVQRIDAFNRANDKPYKLGENPFADLTNEEFTASRNGFKSLRYAVGGAFRYQNVAAVPSSVDWRTRGAVTPVKDQGNCGSCWAFSAVAAVEGLTAITTRNLVSLSEQQIIDCDTGGEDRGCQGGYMDGAFRFIQNRGLTTNAIYPNREVNGQCNILDELAVAATINGYENVPANDEVALLKVVANQPVSVAIDASGLGFQFYESGVFEGRPCGTKLNHGVTVIGYGENEFGTKYWLVKNSWGAQWGEQGYIRLQRDVGLCGVAMDASYPTVM